MTTSSHTAPASPISVAVLGSGRVGGALATALAGLGHPLTVGVRDPEASAARWTGAELTFADTAAAIRSADLVINATPGDSTLERLVAQREALAGRILLDVSNAAARGVDGLPSRLLYPETSLGERLQAELPETRVVKGLNTMLFSVMTAPATLSTPPTAFLSGDDAEAKALVRDVLAGLGWRDEWMLDLGPITTARGTEAVALLVPALLGALGFTPFAISIAR